MAAVPSGHKEKREDAGMELLLDAVDSQQVSDDELIGRHGGARCRADASPTRSAQSTDRVNPEVPGWTKRLWLRSAPPDRTPCLSRMSALEESIRKFGEY